MNSKNDGNYIMSRWNLSDAAFQPLASGEYALVMAKGSPQNNLYFLTTGDRVTGSTKGKSYYAETPKSQENRLAFAAWLGLI